MSVERKRQVFRILDEVLELPPEDRAAFLARTCIDDTLRSEVERMIDTAPAEGLFAEPVFSVHAEDAEIGRRIGPYRLIRLLGRGGMGSVYLAQRDDLDKRVALKLIRRGLELDNAFVERFHNERRILARLEHPYIAGILDGGATSDHLPYFVMEFVEGEPMDEYCASHKLSIERKLELFRDVCSAVHFAHQHLVIHRDLKPGNILIGADGKPKLLDFGIAKLLDRESVDDGLNTLPGQSLMTPRYASPEQVRDEPVTTASDVYSLGVMLYRLLTDRDPYGEIEGRQELLRAICEMDPERPGKVMRGLHRDLDAIVLLAMRKRPGERYSSAEGLSDDIRRHLEGLPVTAQTAGFTYVVGKFVRRYKLAMAVVVAFLVLSTGFSVISTIFWRQAVVERQKARAAFDILFGELGEYELSKEMLEKFLDLAMERYDGDHEDIAKILNNLGAVLIELNDYSAAEKKLLESLEMRARLGQPPERLFRVKNNLATALLKQGKFDAAEKIYLEVMEARLKLYGREDTDVATSLRSLGALYYARGDFKQAESHVRDALGIRRRLLGADDPGVASSLDLLGNVLAAQGRRDEAEQSLIEAVDILLRNFGEDHPDVIKSKKNLDEIRSSRERL